jgi:glycine cleavage system H protein
VELPESYRYTEDHEWIEFLEKDKARIGITEYAVGELGDIVYIELPSPGAKVAPHGVLATVESVKAVAEVYSPVSAQVIEVNEALKEDPQLLKSEPYEKGWIVKIRVLESSEDLMDAEEYARYLATLKK